MRTFVPFLGVCAALDNGVGLVPAMGWGTWNLFGCYDNLYAWTEADVRGVADALVSSGMAAAGYTFVNLDGGWSNGKRNASDGHRQIPDPARFPSGSVQPLADYLRAKGLKLGMYRDRSHDAGFEAVDAAHFAALGADYVKNDGYGAARAGSPHANLSSSAIYALFRDAANATGRPMALNVKFDVQPTGFKGAAAIANSFRVGRDIRPVWADVERLADIAAAVAASGASRPGSFADLDALEVGVPGREYRCPGGPGPSGTTRTSFCPNRARGCVPTGRDATMSETEQRTHMALWCMTASPLIAGNDVRNMSAATRAILTAAGPIGVNQDALGVAGRRVRVEPAGRFETWARPLSGGRFAVLLYNRSASACLPHDDGEVHLDPTPQAFWSLLGFSGRANVTDLWSGDALGVHSDNWPPAYAAPSEFLPAGAHGSRFVLVEPLGGAVWDEGEDEHECPAWGCRMHRKVAAAAMAVHATN